MNPDRDFEDWYLDARPRIYLGVLAAVRSADVAADATDEACARALARWQRVGRMERPTAWAMTVALNVARRRLRRSAHEARLASATPDARVAEPGREIWELVAALGERQRTAIALRYIVGLTEREVGAAMGVARGTAAAALSEARAELRRMLTEEVDEEEVR